MRRESRRELLVDVLLLAVVFASFVALCKIVARVWMLLPGGPFVWAGVAVLFVVFVGVLCVTAARLDREWVDASRRRDSDGSSLADQDGSQSGTADRGVASSGLGPAFSLSSGRSGRPFRRPRR